MARTERGLKMIKGALKLKRQLFPPGWNAEYRLQCDLVKNQLPQILDPLLRKLLGVELLKRDQLEDIKGRDRGKILESGLAPELKPRAEELFYCQGSIPTESGREADELEFEIRLHTRFSEFVGAHHIQHEVKRFHFGNLPEAVKLWQLGLVIPLRVKRFRIGLETFKSQFASSMFGFSPAVSDSLLIDGTQEKLLIQITSEGLKKRDALPLQRFDLISKLDQALVAGLGDSIIKDYQQNL